MASIHATSPLSGVVDSWIAANGKDYVSHTISNPESADSLLQRGYVACAEDLLRSTGSVETEKLPSLSLEEIQALKEIEDLFPKIPERNPGYRLGFGMLVNKKSYADDYTYLVDTHVEAPTDLPPPYVGSYLVKLGSVASAFSKQLDKLAAVHKCLPSTVAIAYDQCKPQDARIDVLLAKAFAPFADDVKRDKYIRKQVKNTMIEARQSVIYPSYVHFKILTKKNALQATDRQVVVLSGKPKAIVAPWQNDGAFSRLHLRDPSSLVLGPKSTLEKHARSLQERGIKFEYFENLTTIERDFFHFKN